MIAVDEDATLELQVKTVKVRSFHQSETNTAPLSQSLTYSLQYFKSIELVATSEGFGQALPSAEMTLKKRDSVLEKLDSPRSPTLKSFLAPPKPDLVRTATAEDEHPAVPATTTISTSSLSPGPPLGSDIVRPVTPEFIPDAMNTRLPTHPVNGLDTPETKDLSMANMHGRVDSLRA